MVLDQSGQMKQLSGSSRAQGGRPGERGPGGSQLVQHLKGPVPWGLSQAQGQGQRCTPGDTGHTQPVPEAPLVPELLIT